MAPDRAVPPPRDRCRRAPTGESGSASPATERRVEREPGVEVRRAVGPRREATHRSYRVEGPWSARGEHGELGESREVGTNEAVDPILKAEQRLHLGQDREPARGGHGRNERRE